MVVIEMKGSYSNALTDISKSSSSLCFGYSYSNNYHLHVSIHCTTWILHCMAWMLMHRLDINICKACMVWLLYACNMCLVCIECFIYNLHWIYILFDIYMGLYANIYKGFIILLLALVYIFIYILMLGLKYSFNEIYS